MLTGSISVNLVRKSIMCSGEMQWFAIVIMTVEIKYKNSFPADDIFLNKIYRERLGQEYSFVNISHHGMVHGGSWHGHKTCYY